LYVPTEAGASLNICGSRKAPFIVPTADPAGFKGVILIFEKTADPEFGSPMTGLAAARQTPVNAET
jgi:hypothetical protein